MILNHEYKVPIHCNAYCHEITMEMRIGYDLKVNPIEGFYKNAQIEFINNFIEFYIVFIVFMVFL